MATLAPQSSALGTPGSDIGSNASVSPVNYGEIVILKKDGSDGPAFSIEQDVHIGRDKDADIRVKMQTVSRTHVKIVIDENGRCHLINMSKTNPTCVNNRSLEYANVRVLLEHNDVFTIGEREFKYVNASLLPEINENDIQESHYNKHQPTLEKIVEASMETSLSSSALNITPLSNRDLNVLASSGSKRESMNSTQKRLSSGSRRASGSIGTYNNGNGSNAFSASKLPALGTSANPAKSPLTTAISNRRSSFGGNDMQPTPTATATTATSNTRSNSKIPSLRSTSKGEKSAINAAPGADKESTASPRRVPTGQYIREGLSPETSTAAAIAAEEEQEEEEVSNALTVIPGVGPVSRRSSLNIMTGVDDAEDVEDVTMNVDTMNMLAVDMIESEALVTATCAQATVDAVAIHLEHTGVSPQQAFETARNSFMQDPRRFSDGHLLSPLKSEELDSDTVIGRRLSRGLSRGGSVGVSSRRSSVGSRRSSVGSVKSAGSDSPSLDLGHLDDGDMAATMEASPTHDEKEERVQQTEEGSNQEEDGEGDTRAFALEIARINGLSEETTNLLSDTELEIVHEYAITLSDQGLDEYTAFANALDCFMRGVQIAKSMTPKGSPTTSTVSGDGDVTNDAPMDVSEGADGSDYDNTVGVLVHVSDLMNAELNVEQKSEMAARLDVLYGMSDAAQSPLPATSINNATTAGNGANKHIRFFSPPTNSDANNDSNGDGGTEVDTNTSMTSMTSVSTPQDMNTTFADSVYSPPSEYSNKSGHTGQAVPHTSSSSSSSDNSTSDASYEDLEIVEAYSTLIMHSSYAYQCIDSAIAYGIALDSYLSDPVAFRSHVKPLLQHPQLSPMRRETAIDSSSSGNSGTGLEKRDRAAITSSTPSPAQRKKRASFATSALKEAMSSERQSCVDTLKKTPATAKRRVLAMHLVGDAVSSALNALIANWEGDEQSVVPYVVAEESKTVQFLLSTPAASKGRNGRVVKGTPHPMHSTSTSSEDEEGGEQEEEESDEEASEESKSTKKMAFAKMVTSLASVVRFVVEEKEGECAEEEEAALENDSMLLLGSKSPLTSASGLARRHKLNARQQTPFHTHKLGDSLVLGEDMNPMLRDGIEHPVGSGGKEAPSQQSTDSGSNGSDSSSNSSPRSDRSESRKSLKPVGSESAMKRKKLAMGLVGDAVQAALECLLEEQEEAGERGGGGSQTPYATFHGSVEKDLLATHGVYSNHATPSTPRALFRRREGRHSGAFRRSSMTPAWHLTEALTSAFSPMQGVRAEAFSSLVENLACAVDIATESSLNSDFPALAGGDISGDGMSSTNASPFKASYSMSPYPKGGKRLSFAPMKDGTSPLKESSEKSSRFSTGSTSMSQRQAGSTRLSSRRHKRLSAASSKRDDDHEDNHEDKQGEDEDNDVSASGPDRKKAAMQLVGRAVHEAILTMVTQASEGAMRTESNDGNGSSMNEFDMHESVSNSPALDEIMSISNTPLAKSRRTSLAHVAFKEHVANVASAVKLIVDTYEADVDEEYAVDVLQQDEIAGENEGGEEVVVESEEMEMVYSPAPVKVVTQDTVEGDDAAVEEGETASTPPAVESGSTSAGTRRSGKLFAPTASSSNKARGKSALASPGSPGASVVSAPTSTAKRGRGRPPKTPRTPGGGSVEEKSSAITAPSPAVSTGGVVKRGRGRPPKTPEGAATGIKSTGLSAVSTPVQADKKMKANSSAQSGTKSVAITASSPAVSTGGVVKRGRGRPPKTPGSAVSHKGSVAPSPASVRSTRSIRSARSALSTTTSRLSMASTDIGDTSTVGADELCSLSGSEYEDEDEESEEEEEEEESRKGGKSKTITKAKVIASASKGPKEGGSTGSSSSSSSSGADYSCMTVTTLKKVAKDRQIAFSSKIRKQELIDLITAED